MEQRILAQIVTTTAHDVVVTLSSLHGVVEVLETQIHVTTKKRSHIAPAINSEGVKWINAIASEELVNY